MINQAIRGSFEYYNNARKEITSLDHAAEVDDGIANLDSSVNVNLWTLNEEMGYDTKIKKRLKRTVRNL
jgi:hypothetical protein